MRPGIVGTALVAVVLCFAQAAAQPARRVTPAPDFPHPEKLTIGYLPVIFHGQVFGAQEKGWLNELGVPKIDLLRFTST